MYSWGGVVLKLVTRNLILFNFWAIFNSNQNYKNCFKGSGVDLKVPSQSQTGWFRRIWAPKPLRQITIDWVLSSSVQSLKSICPPPAPVWENLTGTEVDMNSAWSHGILGLESNVCLFLQKAILMAPVLEALLSCAEHVGANLLHNSSRGCSMNFSIFR